MKDDRTALLEAENVQVYFGHPRRPLRAVDGVSVTIGRGENVGLVGESGCGKSTVARLILQLLEPDGGEISYRGRDISGFTREEMKPLRREIQIIFQFWRQRRRYHHI